MIQSWFQKQNSTSPLMPHDLCLSSWIKQHQFKELLGNYTNPGRTRTRITCQCLFLNYTQCICTSISQTLFQIQVKFHPTLVTGKLPSYYLDLPSSHTSYQSWTVMANMLHQIRRIKTAIPFQIADKTKRRQNHASLQDSRSVTGWLWKIQGPNLQTDDMMQS